MPSDAKWYLVCYDVRDAKRLRKVAKHLEGYGTRVQYSIFRCWLSSKQMQRLRWELTEKHTKPEDHVLFIPICARCVDGLAVAHSKSQETKWPDEPQSHLVV